MSILYDLLFIIADLVAVFMNDIYPHQTMAVYTGIQKNNQ